MKFTVDRDILANSVSWTSHTLQFKSTSPVRMGVLISAKDEVLTLQAVGDDSSSKCEIQAQVEQAGEILVSGKLLADICKALPNKPVNFELDGNKVLIKCGSARFTLITMNIDEYPELNKMPETFGTVDAHEFYNVINQIRIAASKDEMIPVLSSIKMRFVGNKIILIGTDRFRLAKGEINWTPNDEDIDVSVLIKAKNLYDIARSLNNGGTINLAFDKNGMTTVIGFECVGYQVVASLRDGDYPKVESLFPEETPITAMVNTKELMDAIKRVGLVLNPNEPIRFNFSESELTLEAGKGDESQATEKLDVNLNGSEIMVAFNPAYLFEGLNVLETKYAKFYISNPNKAILIKGWDNDKEEPVEEFKYLLMPIRM